MKNQGGELKSEQCKTDTLSGGRGISPSKEIGRLTSIYKRLIEDLTEEGEPLGGGHDLCMIGRGSISKRNYLGRGGEI